MRFRINSFGWGVVVGALAITWVRVEIEERIAERILREIDSGFTAAIRESAQAIKDASR